MSDQTDELLQFHAAEMLDAHAHLDKAGIPRHDDDGEPLTISQRTKLLVDFTASLVMASNVLKRMRA